MFKWTEQRILEPTIRQSYGNRRNSQLRRSAKQHFFISFCISAIPKLRIFLYAARLIVTIFLIYALSFFFCLERIVSFSNVVHSQTLYLRILWTCAHFVNYAWFDDFVFFRKIVSFSKFWKDFVLCDVCRHWYLYV